MPATLLLVAITGAAFSAGDTAARVGTVKTAQGKVVVHRGAETVPVQVGTQLLLNDVLETPADGRVGAILEDGTRIALGPNTELKIDKFVYQPVEGNLGLVLRLGRGLLAYISGRIARLAPSSVSVETPVGVLGLQGTSFAVSIEAP